MRQGRHLATIMHTDSVGHTTLTILHDRKEIDILAKNRALLKPIIEELNGW